MTRKYFMIIRIDAASYHHPMLSDYILISSCVRKLYVIPEGFFIETIFDDDADRKRWLSNIIKSDVDEIMFHEVLYEEFISRKYSRQYKK